MLFWVGNQGNHQNFDPSLLPYKCWLDFHGDEVKRKWNGRLNIFQQNFRDKLMRGASIWLNLPGCPKPRSKIDRNKCFMYILKISLFQYQASIVDMTSENVHRGCHDVLSGHDSLKTRVSKNWLLLYIYFIKLLAPPTSSHGVIVSTIDFWSAGPRFESWLCQISFLIEDTYG